jgi:hypothetical protein
LQSRDCRSVRSKVEADVGLFEPKSVDYEAIGPNFVNPVALHQRSEWQHRAGTRTHPIRTGFGSTGLVSRSSANFIGKADRDQEALPGLKPDVGRPESIN